MLHVWLAGRQVRGCLRGALLALALALALPHDALAARSDDLAAADALSRGGQHAEAAEAYESLAKRAFRGWDTRLALLAAREYLEAGRPGDCERMLGRVGDDVRGDDLVLLSRLQAELALAQGRPADAVEALRRIPEPWPAPLAAELLGLRAQAELASGRVLDGVRSIDSRARVLGSAEERRENYSRLVDALLTNPAATAAVPPDATPGERAWFELGQLLAAPDADAAALARRSADWRSRNPHHPGGDFLPQPGPAVAGVTAASEAQVVALLLPLTGKLAAAGRAVRDGFLAAAFDEQASRRPRIEILDTGTLGAAAAYQRALEMGAGAVAGPLAKEEVAAVAASGVLPVPTLALNSVSLETPPPFLVQFALDPEQEARAVARRIVRDGHVRGVALFPRSVWGERVQAAFSQELAGSGVELTSLQAYDPGAKDFSAPLRAALGRYGGAGDRGPGGALAKRDPVAEARDGPQFVFLAASAANARALVPQLRFQMSYAPALYANSDAVDPGSRAVPDLDGLVFPEMPWILYGGTDAPRLWEVLRREWAAEARGRTRLYAFGYDAYRLLRGTSAATRGVPVGGLSGRLLVGPDGRVQREPDWAQMQGGRPQPAGISLPPAVPGVP